jgi:cell division FtsZ-interacting protein ZapD
MHDILGIALQFTANLYPDIKEKKPQISVKKFTAKASNREANTGQLQAELFICSLMISNQVKGSNLNDLYIE